MALHALGDDIQESDAPLASAVEEHVPGLQLVSSAIHDPVVDANLIGGVGLELDVAEIRLDVHGLDLGGPRTVFQLLSDRILDSLVADRERHREQERLELVERIPSRVRTLRTDDGDGADCGQTDLRLQLTADEYLPRVRTMGMIRPPRTRVVQGFEYRTTSF